MPAKNADSFSAEPLVTVTPKSMSFMYGDSGELSALTRMPRNHAPHFLKGRETASQRDMLVFFPIASASYISNPSHKKNAN
jgi:hypothetical protein